jgi:hypothetical protein
MKKVDYILLVGLLVLWLFTGTVKAQPQDLADYQVISCGQIYHTAKLVQVAKDAGVSHAEYIELLYGMGLYPRDTALFADMIRWVYLGGFTSKELLFMCTEHTTKGI